jgi:hypothetical protein
MAQAADHPTAIERSLDDYHRYIRVTLGCGINVALCEMERRIVAGQLLLMRRQYDVDGNPKGDAVAIDRFAFLGNYALQFDMRGWVRVIPRKPEAGLLPGGISSIKLDESDPNWPVVRLTGRAMDDFDYTVVERPSRLPAAAAPLKPKVWLLAEHRQRQQQNDIPKDITTYGGQLHDTAVEAVNQRRLTNAPSARRFENLLHELSLFPKSKRRTKHARKTHD